MASVWTNKGIQDALTNGTSGKTFILLLVNSTGATLSDATKKDINFVSEISTNELSGTGYARKTLTNVVITEDDTNDRAVLDADDPTTYTGINAGTIAGGWVFRDIGADSADIPWVFLEIADIVTNGGDVSLAFSSNGISRAASA